MCSCGKDKVEVSSGQEDRVNGFMFVFDNRSATESLKNDMDARRIPVKARWKLDKRYETTDEQDIRAIYREMSEMIVGSWVLCRVCASGRHGDAFRFCHNCDPADGRPAVCTGERRRSLESAAGDSGPFRFMRFSPAAAVSDRQLSE